MLAGVLTSETRKAGSSTSAISDVCPWTRERAGLSLPLYTYISPSLSPSLPLSLSLSLPLSLSLSLSLTPFHPVCPRSLRSAGRERRRAETRRARVGETAVVSGRGPETEAARNEKILVLEEDRDNGSEEGKRSRCSLVNTRDGASLRARRRGQEVRPGRAIASEAAVASEKGQTKIEPGWEDRPRG